MRPPLVAYLSGTIPSSSAPDHREKAVSGARPVSRRGRAPSSDETRPGERAANRRARRAGTASGGRFGRKDRLRFGAQLRAGTVLRAVGDRGPRLAPGLTEQVCEVVEIESEEIGLSRIAVHTADRPR